jgi:cellulose synthase operon protein C
MARFLTMGRSIPCAVFFSLAALILAWPGGAGVLARQTGERPAGSAPRSVSLDAGGRESLALGRVRSGETYWLLVNLERAPGTLEDRVVVDLAGAGTDRITKELNAGDPDLYLPYRPREDGQAGLGFTRTGKHDGTRIDLHVTWDHVELPAADRAAIEAEPNDLWQQANELRLGRDVYGSGDDVDYLENRSEGKTGLDWFRFEVKDDKPVLVFFQLDLLDRDVSANLRVYTVDSKSSAPAPVPFSNGKDPMEIVHDRERERYSKHISRTFTRGIYYLEVNANHPDYILRTRVLAVPPYHNASQAVEAGMHYIMNVGDAWFAQVPREGNIYTRASNMHDTATRCTACHASSFSTEANLTAHRNGYEIRSKSDFQYVIDRLYNSITPLYGDDGLFWQRFIGIPLQAQGKQGGILLDFERQVSGTKTRTVERFAPFLARAWATRRELPDDEQNGVVPLDSKFGFAWRDWRVLSELAARTGRADFATAAASISTILGERAADRRIETFQDRIHRLYAWSLLDKTAFASKIKRETGALIRFQNADGGWHESVSGPGPSAVYTTGQLAWTLLRIGLPSDHPALVKAWHYLLAEQQDFGGWFQTTTHENFRTPMRETRYAVMALAEAFPRPGAPLHGWGNRESGSPRLPRSDSLLHTLDDLENIWDVPAADRAKFARAIAQLLENPQPQVRATAAAALGRLGQAESAAPLAARLGDPSKIVWRAAAWALRRLGNDGKSLEVIKRALDDGNPRVHRGATRVFAYQFFGMDERKDLAERLIELCGDPDLWTRLQALKTLRQWFYRTNDHALARRIVETYLARMSMPEPDVVRQNLSEGLYIMLDENLGGGVSLQKNVQQLPGELRPRILEARRLFERDVLFAPLMLALRKGNDLQVSAVLDAFDGSFFKGRFFARQPQAMIDVGNDREFGFLFQPDRQVLESVFARLFSMPLPARSRERALKLAAFFRVLEQSESPGLQVAALERLSDADQAVREAARALVATGLDPSGSEADPRRIALLQSALEGPPESRAAVLQAIGKNQRLSANPEILSTIRKLIARPEAAPSLLPVLRWSVLADAEVVSRLDRAWPRLSQPERSQAVDVLLERRVLLDQADPPESALNLLRLGLADSSPTVRERTLAGVSSLPRLWSSRAATSLLLSALADDSPALRRQGLALGAKRPGFWSRPDALEHLKRLLVDPDAQARELALSVVETHQLLAAAKKEGHDASALARRVKALAADGALKSRALGLLGSNGINPATLVADVELGRTRLLSFSTFRKTVNPFFYRTGEDRQACANCHGNHTILRIAPASPSGEESIEQLMVNYNSALKVVNPGEPEASLVLRKPRSPHGAGGADPTSPTGLTHVGGARWESTESPAYKAILDWIREASQPAAGHEEAGTYSAESYSPGYEPANAGDGDLSTIWHTEFVGASPDYPHEFTVDLGSVRSADGLLYIPRQDSPNGRVKDFEIRCSPDGRTWSDSVAKGRWQNDTTFKYVPLSGKPARYVQLRGLSEVEGRPFMSAAEITIESHPAAK